MLKRPMPISGDPSWQGILEEKADLFFVVPSAPRTSQMMNMSAVLRKRTCHGSLSWAIVGHIILLSEAPSNTLNLTRWSNTLRLGFRMQRCRRSSFLGQRPRWLHEIN
eukprot:4692086-Pyramimonas_sp.AAC.1